MPRLSPFVLFLWLAVMVPAGLVRFDAIADGTAWDTDDFMRMVQVGDWLGGASWFDLRQYRLDPPLGVPMHWTRLADLLPAGLTRLAAAAGYPDQAPLFAALLALPLLALPLMAAVETAGRGLLGRGRAAFAPIVMLVGGVIVPFAPGKVDHHGYQVLAAGLALLMLMLCLLFPHRRAPAATAGLALAGGLWVGMEILPWAALFFLALGLVWVMRGGTAARAARDAALALCAGAAAVAMATIEPAAWFAPACDGFSVASVALGGALALAWTVLTLVPSRFGPIRRLACGAVAGAAVMAGMLLMFPHCAEGGYAAVDPELAALWLKDVTEAQPITTILRTYPGLGLGLALPPVIAFAVALARGVRTHGRQRLLWLVLALHLAAGMAGLLWQIRVFYFTYLYALLPLAWLVGRIRDRLGRGRRLTAALAFTAALLLVSPAPWLMASPLLGASFDKAASAAGDCSIGPWGPDLAGPGVMAAYIDMGPEILWRTRKSVLAAPYHRNNDGNLAALHLFTATDEEAARWIARDRHIDWIAVCAASPEATLYRGKSTPSLSDRLLDGAAPSWLAPLPPKDGSALRLFRVSR